MLQQLISGFAFAICIALNLIVSRVGYSSVLTGDKDILLPFSSMTFLFYPLLIYLPEAHYKFTIFGDKLASGAEQEDQKFPYAFLITLLCVTSSIIVHRLFLFNSVESEEQAQERRILQSKKGTERQRTKNIEYRVETLILKYFLSLGIGLQNIVSAFYITVEQDAMIVKNQFVIFAIFSLIINFSYGYISGWATVSSDLHKKLSIFVNSGIVLGYLLGLLVENNLIILMLPCICCGLLIYSSTLVCLPALFSSGEDQTQDKFRYGAIFTSLLLTVLYHPICYLLRV